MAFGDLVQLGRGTTSATLPSAPTSGNLLVFLAVDNGNQSFTAPTGWTGGTAVGVGGGNSRADQLSWKISNGTETGAISPATGTPNRSFIAEYTGPFAATPKDIENNQLEIPDSGNNKHHSPVVTPTAGINALIVGFFGNDSTTNTWNTGQVNASSTGVSQDTAGTDVVGALFHKVEASTSGTYEFTANAQGSAQGEAGIAIFKAGGLATSKFETISVIDNINAVLNTARLKPNTAEAIAIAEFVKLVVNPLIIRKSESVSVLDIAKLVINPLIIRVSDAVSVLDVVTAALAAFNPTRLYLRDLTADNPPTAGEKSAVLPNFTLGANNATGSQETRALKLVKGPAQTTIAQLGDATTSSRSNYIARYTSDALVAQTFGAGTWNFGLALSEQDGGANSRLLLSVYVWRPSNSSVVGYILDTTSPFTNEWAATEDRYLDTFTGADVTCQDGDVLVVEVWRSSSSQATATAWSQTIYFDGITDVLASAPTNAASWIEYSNKIKFEGTINVNDVIAAIDAAKVVLHLGTRPAETISVSEFTKLVINPLIIKVNEAISVLDSATLNLISGQRNINVNDSISVLDSVTAQLKTVRLHLSVFEPINVSESVKLVLNPFNIKVNEAISVIDSVTALLKTIRFTINNNEAISTIDSATLLLKTARLKVNVNDPISVAEFVNLTLNTVAGLQLNRFESISLIDAATLTLKTLLFHLAVFETISISEFINLQINLARLKPNTNESISISEFVKLILNPLSINVNEAINVSEQLNILLGTPILWMWKRVA